MQHLPENMLEQLRQIYNASLTMGYFPDQLKIAKMIFIPKPGKDHHQPENFRPISLLEVPGKIYEKILNNRLRNFLDENEKYNERQYGFRKKRSTLQAVALATEIISQWKTEDRRIDVVQRDIQKAFDKVWHQGLQYKILQLGLPPPIEKVLCNFIVNRKAKISVGNHMGEEWELESGVPQGSCLSPTLFACYTADIPDPGHDAENIIFADDITQIISYPNKSVRMMAIKTKEEIIRINDFEKKWKIKTSAQKFQTVPVGRRKTAPIVIDGNQYQYHNECTMLGHAITRTGRKKQAQKRITLAKHQLTKLKRFQRLNTKIKTRLYKAYVMPVLEYPPVPMVASPKSWLEKAQVVQNRGLNFAYGNKYNPERRRRRWTAEELHRKAKFEPLNIRLANRARKIWQSIERRFHPAAQLLQNDPQRYNRLFPSSLRAIQTMPQPIYRRE